MTANPSGWVKRILPLWELFWFRDVPPHSYALLRILFGVLGFFSVLGMTPVDQFWTPDGIFAMPSPGGLGLKARIVGAGFGAVVGWTFFVGLLMSFAALAAGYRTGLAVLVSFMGSVFLPYWNRLPLSSAHHVLVVVLFCLVWVDCGRIWSIDARRARKNGDPPVEPSPESIWPLRLIRFQVALIYFNSGLWKLNGEQWRDGSAVHYASALNVFHRFPFEIPAAFDWLTTIGTYATLAWEISFPLMLLYPWTRRLALLIGVLLHAGMAATLELGPFSAFMIASYLAFLDPDAVARFSREVLARLADRRDNGARTATAAAGTAGPS